MTELETIAHAKKYLDEMANGKNPLTGEAVSETDLINNVRISRCLFFVSDILRRILDQGGVTPPKRGDKAPFYLTPEQLLGFAFSDQPIPVSEITRRINALIDDNTMKTLRYSSITEYLMNYGFLYEVTLPTGNTTKRPTDSGNEIGLSVEERTSTYGNYLVTLYNSEAQHFIIDNFSAILEIANTPKQKPEKLPAKGKYGLPMKTPS